jgi:hypothetical protein
MPHEGHAPGASAWTAGHIGQTQAVAAVAAAAAPAGALVAWRAGSWSNVAAQRSLQKKKRFPACVRTMGLAESTTSMPQTGSAPSTTWGTVGIVGSATPWGMIGVGRGAPRKRDGSWLNVSAQCGQQKKKVASP